MMKTIALTKGYAAIVDDSDYEILAQHKWRADVKSHTVYAVRWAKSESGRKLIHKYKAKIQVNGKHYNLGYFMTAELAHKAYCEAAKTLCGDFARLA